MIAFLDASALIYLLEGQPAVAARVQRVLADLRATHRGLGLAISRLSRLECRLAPLRDGDPARLATFDAFFDRAGLIIVDVDAQVIDLATAIRARHGARTPDAIQAACCLQLGRAHRMLTGDRGFRRIAGLEVVLV